MNLIAYLQLYLAATTDIQPQATRTTITKSATVAPSSSIEKQAPTPQTTRQKQHLSKKQGAKNDYDPVLDWKPPSPRSIQRVRQGILRPMKALTSPVFFSTDDQGICHEGLQHAINQDDQNPILFVSNHQLLGLDSFLVVNQLEQDCGLLVRSLTAPFLYPPFSPSTASFVLDGTSFFETYGCLPVSPRNFYRLLQSGQSTLLFPGGVQEAFVNTRAQATAYDLQEGWTNKESDFVRLAARFNATIVPFSSIGAAESAWFWKDLPVLSDWYPTVQSALQSAAGARAPVHARFDAPLSIDFPLVVPKGGQLVPHRHYYLFGQPIPLKDVDSRDKDTCRAIYETVQERIQDGCQRLVQVSADKDPYSGGKHRSQSLRRFVREQMWRRPAPTFSADELNAPPRRDH